MGPSRPHCGLQAELENARPETAARQRLAYDTISSEPTLVATEVAGSSRADLANAVIAAHSGARARVLLKEERVAA